jgi:hypothetical protein
MGWEWEWEGWRLAVGEGRVTCGLKVNLMARWSDRRAAPRVASAASSCEGWLAAALGSPPTLWSLARALVCGESPRPARPGADLTLTTSLPHALVKASPDLHVALVA